jgi:hypothetical protein
MKVMLPFILAGWFLWTFWARADEKSKIEKSLGQLNSINSNQRDLGCFMGQDASGYTCTQHSDEFCTALADDNSGNMRIFDGEIKAGASPKSGLSYAQLEDYKALVASAPRLPADFRKKAAPLLARLDKALKSENDTLAWKRQIADIKRDLDRAQEDVIADRQQAIAKDLAALSEAEAGFKSGQVEAKLKDEIVDAKYADHPNWKRVEALFPKAQEYILKTLETLPLTPKRKAEMMERVRTVRLMLPYENPEKFNRLAEGCSTTEVNASYRTMHHNFTVCAGYFNTYQSPSALLTLMMHEISHSIDPSTQGILDCRAHSPLMAAVSPLNGAKGPAMSCDQWAKVTEKVLTAKATPPIAHDLDKLYRCLSGKKLKPWDQKEVWKESELLVKAEIERLSSLNQFTKLAQPYMEVGGEKLDNHLYLRPDRILLAADHRPKTGVQGVDPQEIFTQALACQSVKRGGKAVPYRDKSVTEVERREMFNKALSATEAMFTKLTEDTFSYCGKRCPGLVGTGMSQHTGEHFADWLANRSAWRHLARIPAGKDRAIAATAAWGWLCAPPGPIRSAPGLALEESKRTSLVHPEDRRRRLSTFDEFTAELVGCKLEKSAQENYGSCEP